MKYECDFSGWATKNNLRCSDGRTIMKDAFKDQDGQRVPLVWNHQHDNPENVLGHAILENRDEGVYAYGFFNDTELGQNAKELVRHGDIVSMSIYANRLRQQGGSVLHGAIREVSLVFAGANPGAFIENVLSHGEESEEEAVIYTGEEFDDTRVIEHADDQDDDEEGKRKERTVGDVIDTMNEEQKNVLYGLVGMSLTDDMQHDDNGGNNMKRNVFDQTEVDQNTNDCLSHAEQQEIINLAKSKGVGSLHSAMVMYAEDMASDDELEHSFSEEDMTTLFPEFKNMMPGDPELIPQNDSWITTVMNGVHKTPFSRIRTRQADATALRAPGYKTKGSKKSDMGNIKLIGRTTDPQTIYIKDKLNRDDILDITDFDVVNYEYGVMRSVMNEEIATAILIGDGRDDGAEDKIENVHVRPIWLDDELYTIHVDVDVAAAKASIQGTNTALNFGDDYVFAEAIIAAALHASEQYKGSGSMVWYCTPRTLNRMLLARDLNGRRIYSSKADLAAALNVSKIETVEKFENKTRKTDDPMPKTKKLLGLFVNMNDYNVGAVRGGEITRFNDFDIDFNQEKFLIETRLSGALTRVKSAIAIEEPVEEA